MKILLLPVYFQPEIVASSYLRDDRNEAFIKEGYFIEIHAPSPSRGISKKIRNGYKKKKVEHLYDGKLVINRFSLFQEGKSSIIRVLRYTFCCVIQFYKGWRVKNIDVMFITSTPPIQGAMAALLKKIKKVPFIYNLQDIFPDSLVGTGLTKKGSFLWKIGRTIEDFTYRNADKIIVISEDFKRNIIEKGVPENKIEVIYNWVNEREVVNVSRENNKLFDKYNLDRKQFYVTYCGNIGLTQNLDLLLEVAKELEPIRDIHFVLIGEGVYKEKLEKLICKNDIINIALLPFQPYEDISHVFSLGNVSLVISKPGTGLNSLPSKTWSIMSAERPVLASFDENELKQIINDNNCGIFVKAGDKIALKDAIFYLYDNRKEAQIFGRNGREFVMKNLTREIGTAKYVNVIKQFAPL